MLNRFGRGTAVAIIIISLLFLTIVIGGFVYWYYFKINKEAAETPWPTPSGEVRNFEECISKGYPALESYPRQGRTAEGKLFVEDIGNELEKQELIRVSYPRPNDSIKSPLIIEGKARGYWFFEASFPIELWDKDIKTIRLLFLV